MILWSSQWCFSNESFNNPGWSGVLPGFQLIFKTRTGGSSNYVNLKCMKAYFTVTRWIDVYLERGFVRDASNRLCWCAYETMKGE